MLSNELQDEEFSFKQYFVPLTKIKAIQFIILLGFIVFFYSLFNGFVADDNVYILQNPHITNFKFQSFLFGSSYYSGDVTSLAGIYYKPIFTFVVALIYKLSSGTPFLFHLVQLILHITNSCLVFLLFRTFFRRGYSFLLAVIFLVHPANVESVVYIANLQEPLFFFFGITALLTISHIKKISWQNITAVSVLLLFSLLSKESGILFLPAAIMLFVFSNRKNLVPGLFITGGVFSLYLFLRLVIAHVTVNRQAISPIMEAPLWERLLTIPKIISSYLLLFFFPKDLAWGQHWIIKSMDVWNFYFPLITCVIVSLVVLVFYFYIKRKKQLVPAFIFFTLISLVGLALHVQIIPLDFTFADRWIYFPIMGFLGLLGVLLQSGITEKLSKPLLLFMAIFLAIILSTRSFVRTLDWKDDYTLTTHDVRVNSNSFVIYNNLGYALISRNEYKEAKIQLRRSIDLYPTENAYVNLAYVESKLGNSEAAITLYKNALHMSDFYMTYQNLIAEYIRQNKLDQARNETKTALDKYPNNPKLWLLMAVVEYKSGNIEDAVKNAQQANFLLPGVANLVLSKIINNEEIPL